MSELAAIWNGHAAEVNERVQLEKGSPEAIADARKRLREAIERANHEACQDAFCNDGVISAGDMEEPLY
jgi:hypothetical protein